MILSTALVFAAVALAQPAPARTMISAPAPADSDRTPIRCRPAPYYVADQGDREKPERLLVTGTRVPLIVRDYDRRPKPPCLLMRDDGASNPLRPAD